jgi:hypothetical protein
MVTFEKRGNIWRASVNRRGCPDQTPSFNTKALAIEWARVLALLSVDATHQRSAHRNAALSSLAILKSSRRRYAARRRMLDARLINPNVKGTCK